MLSTKKISTISKFKETFTNLVFEVLSSQVTRDFDIGKMEGYTRRTYTINGGNLSPRSSSRPIPKRGQVKVAIVVGLAHSVASVFSPSRR